MRLCLFPCLLGTLRDEGSEEEDVLKEMPAKGWKESPVRIVFSRMLGLILFSMFLKNSACVWFWCTPGKRNAALILCIRSEVPFSKDAKSCCSIGIITWAVSAFAELSSHTAVTEALGRCWTGELSGIVTLLRNYALFIGIKRLPRLI